MTFIVSVKQSSDCSESHELPADVSDCEVQ